MNLTADRTGRLRSGLSTLIVALEWISSVTLFLMMMLTFADVVGRYLFSRPILGSSEMIASLLALTIFAGLGITNARDEHIVVELFDQRIRRPFPRLYDVCIQLFSIGAMGLIAFVLLEFAFEAYHTNARTFVLEIPTWYATGAVAVLAVISVISQISGVYLILRSAGRTRH
ncbi:MAG: TRAP transporter small permease [Pararhodobacter sp.]|nr:TRAP transporter small permease [Pararhodobacter sp.]